MEKQDHLQVAGRAQVSAIPKEASKESQDWEAQAAQEVAAALARGANLGALVDRKERRAEYLLSKAKRLEAEASSKPHAPGLVEAAAVAQAEVPAKKASTSLHSRAWFPFSAVIFYRERKPTSSTVLLGREQVTAARSAVWLLLKELTTRGQLSITAAFLSRLPSAAARLWQQVPRQNANGIIDFGRIWSRVRSIRVCRGDCCCGSVVPASCFDGQDCKRKTASKFRSLGR